MIDSIPNPRLQVIEGNHELAACELNNVRGDEPFWLRAYFDDVRLLLEERKRLIAECNRMDTFVSGAEIERHRADRAEKEIERLKDELNESQQCNRKLLEMVGPTNKEPLESVTTHQPTQSYKQVRLLRDVHMCGVRRAKGDIVDYDREDPPGQYIVAMEDGCLVWLVKGVDAERFIGAFIENVPEANDDKPVVDNVPGD